MRRCACGLAAAFLLLSCTAAPKTHEPKVDPLEERARAGDPVAACEFAVRNLHTCARDKQRWESGLFLHEPACVETPLGERGEEYLDKAMPEGKGPEYTTALLERASLSLLAAQLVAGPSDPVVAKTRDPEQYCASLLRQP